MILEQLGGKDFSIEQLPNDSYTSLYKRKNSFKTKV